jgi:hypothetical protein
VPGAVNTHSSRLAPPYFRLDDLALRAHLRARLRAHDERGQGRRLPVPSRRRRRRLRPELTYRLTGQPLYYVGDVVFRSGRVLGSVFVSATDDIG